MIKILRRCSNLLIQNFFCKGGIFNVELINKLRKVEHNQCIITVSFQEEISLRLAGGV